MADINPANPTPDPDPTPSPAQNGDVPATWEEIFQHPRFKQLNERAKQAEVALEKARKEQEAGRQKELKEQERWKELYDQAQLQLRAEQVERLRLQVAGQAGLPTLFASRLQGETEEEMLEDARRLKEFLKPDTPGVPPAGARRQPTAITAEQLNDPEWVRKNKQLVREAAQGGTLRT